MTTQCFLVSRGTGSPTQFSTGNNDAKLDGTTSGWIVGALATARGSGLVSSISNTAAGPTSGVEVATVSSGSIPNYWISPPLDQAVTISGTVTFNLWMGESATAANAGAQCVVERIDSTGAIASTVVNSEKAVEMPKSSSIAAQNWTASPTSTAFQKGDRIRICPAANDAGGTMASGNTFTFDYNGNTAAADGDSYVTFNETFGFLTTDPVQLLQTDRSGGNASMGDVSGNTALAQSFTATGAFSGIQLSCHHVGTPTDNVVLELRTDNAGAPSTTVVSSATVAGTSTPSGGTGWFTFALPATVLTSGNTYWIVYSRDGALDASNFYAWAKSASDVYAGGQRATYNGTTWTASTAADQAFQIAVNTLYPSTTAAPDMTADEDLAMWTARGASAAGRTATTASTWATPIQVKNASTLCQWFSRPLIGFTLAAPVLATTYCTTATASVCAVRCAIYLCNSDGTSPTLWGATSYPATFTSAADQIASFYVSGADTVVTNGQRLLVRFYMDDGAQTAMAGSAVASLRINGPTVGADGDTFLAFGQALTEAILLPDVAMAQHRAP